MMSPRTRSSTPNKNAGSPKAESAKKRRTRSLSQGEKSVEESSPKKATPMKLDSPSKKQNTNNKKTKTGDGLVVAKATSTPSVDLFVHRLRHLRHIPSAILCIKPSPPPSAAGKKKGNNFDTYIAMSRQGGQVELRSARQKFRTLATVAGWSSTAIHAMAWTYHPRTLVGATQDGSVVVVDFQRGHFRNVTPSGGGQIHALDSFASSSSSPCGSLVGAACEDGSVRFFGVDETIQNADDTNMPMPVVSTIPSSGAPILSLALNRFGMVNKESSSSSPLAGATAFVGVADGTIRRYDHGSSSWKSILRITVENLGRNIPTRIWTLKSLHDGTVVSGDSLGHVQLWDGHTGTLEASFHQNNSKADVLSLDLTRDQNKLFASGVDSRVICIERSVEATEDRKWILSNAQRPHTHDVQAVAICYRSRKKGSGGSEILCTGGVDTKLCTYAVNDFQRQRPHTLFPWPARCPIDVAPDRRVISIMRHDGIQVYALAPRPDSSLASRLRVPDSDSLLGTVKIESHFNLSVSAISANGKYLVVGNPSNILLFQLAYRDGKGSSKPFIKPERLVLELPSSSSILAAKFAGNNRLFLCSADRIVHIVGLSANEGENVTSVASVASTISFATDDTDARSILPHDGITCSADGKWFAVMRTSAEKGSVQVFKEIDGTFVHWWSIPDLDVAPATAAFLHTDQPQFVLVCSNFEPYVFDLEGRCLSNWSKGAPFPIGEALPSALFNRKDFPLRIAVNPASPSHFFVVSLDPSRQVFANAKKVIPGSISDNHFFCFLGCHPCDIDDLSLFFSSGRIHKKFR